MSNAVQGIFHFRLLVLYNRFPIYIYIWYEVIASYWSDFFWNCITGKTDAHIWIRECVLKRIAYTKYICAIRMPYTYTVFVYICEDMQKVPYNTRGFRLILQKTFDSIPPEVAQWWPSGIQETTPRNICIRNIYIYNYIYVCVWYLHITCAYWVPWGIYPFA